MQLQESGKLIVCLLLGLPLLSDAALAQQASIPLKTWVARPAPKIDQGPCPDGNCKHMRLAHNPLNGRIYFLGGDYAGIIGYDSGRNEVYSYSIGQGNWILEQPYCTPPGSVQPSHPDEVGWVFDSKRNLFWMLPGYMGADQGECSSTLIRGKIMTFDPVTKVWKDPQRTAGVTGEATKFAQHDPVTDTIIRFYFDGGSGASSLVYNITTDTWTPKVHTGSDVNDAYLGEEYSALDVEGRLIWLIDIVKGKLYKYNIDTRQLSYVTQTPAKNVQTGETAPYDCAMPIWDSVNKVLLWPHISNFGDARITLYIYHPATNTWETDRMVQPDGLTVTGNSAVFDPYQNALLVMGGRAYATPYLFLYRYGDGSPSVDRLPPASPQNLRIR